MSLHTPYDKDEVAPVFPMVKRVTHSAIPNVTIHSEMRCEVLEAVLVVHGSFAVV